MCIGISRAAYYREPGSMAGCDDEVIDALNEVLERHPRWGFWKCYKAIRRKGHRWNHKRVYRVYCELGLNQKRRARRRLPKRERQSLDVPCGPSQVWSGDFMSDALYHGRRFRTFNVIDDYNREAIAIEIDTSITSRRLIRMFERIKEESGLPEVLRVDNGPELISGEFVSWAESVGMRLQYIEPGKPDQNAYIERFNRTYREEVLDLYIFRDLEEVREITYWWMIDYNENRPHDSLGGLPPLEYRLRDARNSTLELST